jgi:hypothetical protein
MPKIPHLESDVAPMERLKARAHLRRVFRALYVDDLGARLGACEGDTSLHGPMNTKKAAPSKRKRP